MNMESIEKLKNIGKPIKEQTEFELRKKLKDTSTNQLLQTG